MREYRKIQDWCTPAPEDLKVEVPGGLFRIDQGGRKVR